MQFVLLAIILVKVVREQILIVQLVNRINLDPMMRLQKLVLVKMVIIILELTHYALFALLVVQFVSDLD